MELKEYFRIVQRWLWLLVLGLVLGGVGGYLGSRMQDPVYQASTRAMVMRPPLEQSSDLTFYSDQQLVQTYIQLLTTQPVLEAASERLGYAVKKEQVSVQQSRDTQIIQVTVEDRDRERVADIANVLVEVLIEQNDNLQAGRFASTEESIQAQITQVEGQLSLIQGQVDQISTKSFQDQLEEVRAQIEPLETEVSALQQEIAALPTWNTENRVKIAEKQARIEQIEPLLNLYQQIYSNLIVLGKPLDASSDTTSRLAQLQSTLGLYQQLYLNLLSSLETVRLARLQNTPNIVLIEPAVRPGAPIRPRTLVNTALSMAVGLMLAAGIVFLIEYLDDTLKTPEDVARVLGLPVLGFVAEMKYRNNSAEEVYVSRQPRSPVSEAFRSLRTNLEFAAVQKPIRSLLVTSPGPAEGKTTVATNLAAIFSQANKRVALVDGDMRRPHIHSMFGMSNRDGLSNLFRNQASPHSVSRSKVDLPHLMIITSGSLPPNPAELLGSERMEQILKDLDSLVDTVVIDTPPSVVADAQVLAAKVDAVVMVIQPGVTHAEAARVTLETFKRAGARVVGVVLNRIPRNRNYYYGGYQYYSPYNEHKGYYSPNGSKPAQQPEEQARTYTAELPAPNSSYLTRISEASEMPGEYPDPDPSKN
jgi:capsular exopolysaccharide synthesis family protein